jgi:ATP-dependent NAD(P)H-hydrate dehydratase
VEFRRLLDVAGVDTSTHGDVKNQVQELAKIMGGVTILRKGRTDLISAGSTVVEVIEEGSPRRCGGQGDLLAGSLGVALHWAHSHSLSYTNDNEDQGYPILNELYANSEEAPNVLACIFASILTRRAARLAFAQHKRATSSVEILSSIGEAFESMVPTKTLP